MAKHYHSKRVEESGEEIYGFKQKCCYRHTKQFGWKAISSYKECFLLQPRYQMKAGGKNIRWNFDREGHRIAHRSTRGQQCASFEHEVYNVDGKCCSSSSTQTTQRDAMTLCDIYFYNEFRITQGELI
eukprot:855744-Amphidinium_carterae.1